MATQRFLDVRPTRRRGTPAARALSMKQLVATLRQRLGRRPPAHTLPGLSPMETYRLYDTLCTVTRAYGIRY